MKKFGATVAMGFGIIMAFICVKFDYTYFRMALNATDKTPVGLMIFLIVFQIFAFYILFERVSYMSDGVGKGKRTINFVTHLSGLPVAQGQSCKLVYNHDRLTIESKGNVTYIDYFNIESLGTRTKREVESYYGTSILGAVVGNAVFGLPGMLLCGIKRRDRVNKQIFYEIVYKSGNGQNKILLQINEDALYKINILNSDIEWRSGCKVK